MEKPIVNPELPYTGEIAGGLKQGRMVRIQGAVTYNADRFSINLQTGSNISPRDDTALHISVRLKQGYIARNSYINRGWGEEHGRGNLPIGPGQQFEIIVLIDEQDFKIAVNGQHFCEFPYRIPKEKVHYLVAEGDVHLTLISWENVLPPSAPNEEARSASAVEGGATPGAAPGAPLQGFQGAPPGDGFGAPPQGFQGGPPGGPPQGFGPPQGYGPPPQGYGPPPQGPGFGPPPPPGSEPQSGLDHIFTSAQSLLSEAISSGAAEKLLSSILNPNQQNQGFSPQQAQYGLYPQLPPQQEQRGGYNAPQYGGEGSVGGLGGIGSFLSNLAGQVLNSPKGPQGGQGQYYRN